MSLSPDDAYEAGFEDGFEKAIEMAAELVMKMTLNLDVRDAIKALKLTQEPKCVKCGQPQSEHPYTGTSLGRMHIKCVFTPTQEEEHR